MKVGKYVISFQIFLICMTIISFNSFSHMLIILSEIILLFICVSNYKSIDSLFSPLNIFLIACDISFTIKGLNILEIEKFTNDAFNDAFTLYIIFILFVSIGLLFNNNKSILSLYSNLSKRSISKKKLLKFSFWAIPLVILLYFSKMGTFDLKNIFTRLLDNRVLFQNSGGLYTQTIILSVLKIVFYVSMILYFDKKVDKKIDEKLDKKINILRIVSFVTLIVIAFSLGGRGEIFFPFIALLFIEERKKGKYDIKKILILSVVILVFSGWYGLMRDGETNSKIKLNDTVNNVLNRYVQLDNCIRLVSNPIDYPFGKSIVDFLSSPIPRSYMPNKPYPFNSQMTQIYLPIQFKRKIVSDFTTVSELYLNFGYIGLMVGGVLFGLILKYACIIYLYDNSSYFLILYPFLLLKPMSIFYGGMINSNANMMLILETVVVSNIWLCISERSK